MEYNSQRETITLPEYGRNLHKMVEKVVNTADREKRTRYAHQLIEVMAQLHNTAKDSPEMRHKLWDHLHIMAGFQLDVDSPFPPPSQEVLHTLPKPLAYPKGNLKYNFYGRNIQDLINKVAGLEDGQEKEVLVRNIANQMKKSYLLWNRDSVEDSLIAQHLWDMSHHRLRWSENFQLTPTHEILGLQQQPNKKKSKSKSRHDRAKKKGKFGQQV